MVLCEPKYTVQRFDPPNGSRFYTDNDGNRYPSVTSVLGAIPNPHLEEWKNRVGEDEAKRIASEAASRGTVLHEAIEDFYNGKDILIEDKEISKRFKTLKEFYLQKFDPLLLEYPLASKRLKLAGTVDMVAMYKGNLVVVDFKTSSRTKRKSWIDSYFAQTTAYSVMVQEMFDVRVKSAIVLIANFDSPFPSFFEVSPSYGASYLEKALRHYHGKT